MMIRIFAMKATEHDFLASKWSRYLSKQRQTEAKKRKNVKERQLFLGAEVLLNRSLEIIDATVPLPAAYKRNPYGKPYLLLKDKIKVNWSHSGEYVICALSDHEVGTDLQYAKKEPKESLIQKVLQPEEYTFYKKVPTQEQTKLFYKYWTIKESFLKAIGTGFHTSLDSFYVRMDKRNPKIVQREYGKPYDCRLLDFADSDYIAAICCEGKIENIKIEYLE